MKSPESSVLTRAPISPPTDRSSSPRWRRPVAQTELRRDALRPTPSGTTIAILKLLLLGVLIPLLARKAAGGPLDNWSTAYRTPTPNRLSGVAHGNGIFVAVGMNYTGDSTLLTSTNGIDWVQRTAGTPLSLRAVTFGAGRFVAVGDAGGGEAVILSSDDGSTWHPQSSGVTRGLAGVAYGNGMFAGAGDAGTIVTSGQGTVWAEQNIGSTVDFLGIGYGNGTFVAVGRNGNLFTSQTGSDWRRQNAGTDRDLFAVTHGEGLFTAVGGGFGSGFGVVTTSADATDWTAKSVPGVFAPIRGVAFGAGLFAAVCTQGEVLFSPDGLDWIRRLSAREEDFTGVTYGDGHYVAVTRVGISGSRIFVSSDGATWTSPASGGFDGLRAVAFGAGMFVVAGDSGTLLSSPDTEHWTRSPAPNPTVFFQGVAFGNGRFVAVGARMGAILVSENGADWVQVDSRDFTDVTFGSGWFVAIEADGRLHRSRNGRGWTPCGPQDEPTLKNVSYVPGGFLALGDNTILRSGWIGPARLTVSAPGPGNLPLIVNGEAGRPYDLEGASDLPAPSWTTLSRFTNSQEVGMIYDPDGRNLPRRFHRLRQSDYAPATLAGREVVATIRTGSGALSPAGSYRFSAGASGDTYTLTALTGPTVNDFGTYHYARTSPDAGLLVLTNSFGWVIRNEIYFSGTTSGELESEVGSGPAGFQSAVFELP